MSKELLIELFGYLGSFLVLVSFLMTSVAKLRIVNTVGSVIFMIYALIIRSYPTAIMNFCLVVINLRFLWKAQKMGKEYEMVKIKKDEAYFCYLLTCYKDDIEEFFPGLSLSFEDSDDIYLTHCERKCVGITVGRRNGEEMEILLDYSIPEFRDFTIGTFVYRKTKEEGIKKLIYRGPDEKHQKYLQKMGYIKTGAAYVKTF